MAIRKTKVQFTTIEQAYEHFALQGYFRSNDSLQPMIMTKHDNGQLVGEVVVHQDAPLTVTAEKIELAYAVTL